MTDATGMSGTCRSKVGSHGIDDPWMNRTVPREGPVAAGFSQTTSSLPPDVVQCCRPVVFVVVRMSCILDVQLLNFRWQCTGGAGRVKRGWGPPIHPGGKDASSARGRPWVRTEGEAGYNAQYHMHPQPSWR